MWWRYVLMYVLVSAVAGRIVYRFGDLGVDTEYAIEKSRYGYDEKVATGYVTNRYPHSTIAWLSLVIGLLWPGLILWGIVGWGNKTKVERVNHKRRIQREKDVSLREREIRVLEMERELGIRR